MKRFGYLLALIIAALLATNVVLLVLDRNAEREHRRAVEAEMHRLATSVDRLATNMERILHAQDLLMDPIVIVHGDEEIGDPIETTWRSGDDVILVKVYKATVEETGATQLRRSAQAVADAGVQYPPN